MQRPLLSLLILATISLAACAGNKDTVLPSGEADIKDIYERHMSVSGVSDRAAARAKLGSRPLSTADADLNGYVRDAFNELDTHFPRLPNPTLVLYVFPHLVGSERVPVPGYSTTFPMYRHIEYALPGELQEASLRAPSN